MAIKLGTASPGIMLVTANGSLSPIALLDTNPIDPVSRLWSISYWPDNLVSAPAVTGPTNNPASFTPPAAGEWYVVRLVRTLLVGTETLELPICVPDATGTYALPPPGVPADTDPVKTIVNLNDEAKIVGWAGAKRASLPGLAGAVRKALADASAAVSPASAIAAGTQSPAHWILAEGAGVNSNRTVRPEFWGALGDGSTDDAAAIQSAINYLRGLNGGTLLLRGVTYAIGSTLKFGDVSSPLMGINVECERAASRYPEACFKWIGSVGGTLAKVRNARNCRIRNLGFNGAGIADIGLQFIHVTGDANVVEHWDIETCFFTDARDCNVLIDEPDGASSIDGDESCLRFSNCWFRHANSGAATNYHVRQRSSNAFGNSFEVCQFDGDGSHPSYAIGVQSGGCHFFGCISVGSGLQDVHLDADGVSVPGYVTVYGWETQSREFLKVDRASSPIAVQRNSVFSGVGHTDITATGSVFADISDRYYGQIQFQACRSALPVNIGATSFVTSYGMNFAGGVSGEWNVTAGGKLEGMYIDVNNLPRNINSNLIAKGPATIGDGSSIVTIDCRTAGYFNPLFVTGHFDFTTWNWRKVDSTALATWTNPSSNALTLTAAGALSLIGAGATVDAGAGTLLAKAGNSTVLTVSATIAIDARSLSTGFLNFITKSGQPIYADSDKFNFRNAATGQYLEVSEITPGAGDAKLLGRVSLALTSPSLVKTTCNGHDAYRIDSSGNVAIFGGAGGNKPTITGVLSAVTDGNAKAVLTSIIAALVQIDAATNGTT